MEKYWNQSVFIRNLNSEPSTILSFFLIYRVFSAITFGGQALGRATALSPDVGKAKMAAAKMFELFDRKPVPDSSDTEGMQPVNDVYKLYTASISARRNVNYDQQHRVPIACAFIILSNDSQGSPSTLTAGKLNGSEICVFFTLNS